MLQRKRDERGGMAVFVGLIVFAVIIPLAAIGVDLGMQRVVRRDMQALADVVALDLARHLNSGTTEAALRPVLDDVRQQSQLRNASALGDPPVVTYDLGYLDDDGAFVESSTDITAVRVNASGSVNYALMPGDGAAVRSAIAEAEEAACFRVGSYLATVNSSQSVLLNAVLGSLLDSTVDLTAGHYTGLAGANVTLLGLVEAGHLGVGTVEELLALDSVSVGTLFLAAASALDQQGDLVAADLLRGISVAAGTPTIAIADIISASGGPQAALEASLDVLSLVTASAFAANSGNAVSIPNLGVSLPGVAETTTTLTVISPPRMECGRVGTTAETAQVELAITARINGQTINVPTVGNITLAPTDITFSIDLGEAVAELKRVTCDIDGPDSLTVGLRSSLVGSLVLGASTGASATLSIPGGNLLTLILDVLGLGSLLQPPQLILNSTITAGSVSTGSDYERDVTVPIPGAYTEPAGGGPGPVIGGLNLAAHSDTTLRLRYYRLLLGWSEMTLLSTSPIFDAVLTPLITSISGLLTPILNQLQAAVVTPLSTILGLQLGGADVFAVPTPSCGAPRLTG